MKTYRRETTNAKPEYSRRVYKQILTVHGVVMEPTRQESWLKVKHKCRQTEEQRNLLMASYVVS